MVSGMEPFPWWCMHGRAVPKAQERHRAIVFCILLLIASVEMARAAVAVVTIAHALSADA